MSRQLGYHVIDLQRISITHLSIEGLALNHWRYLTTDEIVQLQQTISKPAKLLIPS
jgi:16S rRNA U516 pseudouridylate synthase RsuA-like enzyme